jgi:hypothetical protein
LLIAGGHVRGNAALKPRSSIGADLLPLDDRFEIPPRRARQKSLAFRGTGKRRKLTCVDSASLVRSKR